MPAPGAGADESQLGSPAGVEAPENYRRRHGDDQGTGGLY
jgi:hypothetical protein